MGSSRSAVLLLLLLPSLFVRALPPPPPPWLPRCNHSLFSLCPLSSCCPPVHGQRAMVPQLRPALAEASEELEGQGGQ